MEKLLYQAIKETVEEIESGDDKFLATCARRKLDAISEDSPLATLLRVGKDLELIASKIGAR